MDRHTLPRGMYHGIGKDAGGGTQGYENEVMTAESGYFGHYGLPVRRFYLADLSDGSVRRAAGQDRLTAYLDHLSQGAHGVHLIQDRIVLVQYAEVIFS